MDVVPLSTVLSQGMIAKKKHEVCEPYSKQVNLY